MAKKPAPNIKRILQSFEDEEAETGSTSSTRTILPEQDQNPRNIQSTSTIPSAPLPPQQSNPSLHYLGTALVTVLEDSGYNLTSLRYKMAQYAESQYSHRLFATSSNNTEREPAISSLSNLGRQPRTRLYRYQCIFKDSNGQCQTRGRGPPGKVTKFLCEEHTVQEEQVGDEDEEYENEEDEEDEEIDDGEDEGAEGEILKGDEDEAHIT